VLNRDIIEELSAREASLRVRYTWVRGHVGHPVNEICDALASAVARGQPGPGQDDVFAALRAENLLGAADLPSVVAAIGGSIVASIGETQPDPVRSERGQLTMRL
jgi:ribonuclease HI